jgi:5-methyltetrahydropteroyltriglutamate--homocysteine methyltransferase
MTSIAEPDTVATPRAIPRAEMVGSLLKPPRLQELFRRVYDGISAQEAVVPPERGAVLDELHEVAREATIEVVAKQIALGLDVVGDGEMRRGYFLNSLYDGVSGLRSQLPDDDPLFALEPYVAERMEKVANPLRDELRFLRTLTDRPIKASVPAPSIYHMQGYARSEDAYPDAYAFIDDVVRIERQLVGEAIADGADYIQFDYPIYTTLVDPHARDWVSSDPRSALDHGLRSDAAVLDGVPGHVTTAIHMCRGNFKSESIVTGALDPVAERVFNELPHDRFLVEWNDEDHTGGFDAIRFVPKDKVLVMGLVSTQNERLETADEILRKLEEAQRFLPIEQLALSPQCGFASFFEGNENARDVMWRKLELVAEVADRVWPR